MAQQIVPFHFFRKSDGMNGLGFRIQFAGTEMYSVSWAEGPGDRFTDRMIESHGIEVEEIEVIAKAKPTGKPKDEEVGGDPNIVVKDEPVLGSEQASEPAQEDGSVGPDDGLQAQSEAASPEAATTATEEEKAEAKQEAKPAKKHKSKAATQASE